MVADLSENGGAESVEASYELAGDVATVADPLAGARRVVIKIGSALLVDQNTGLRRDWLDGLADDVSMLRAEQVDVLIVSSGSVALGRLALGLEPGELSLDQAQAAAAVGQIELARAYSEALGRRGHRAGQVLLTLDDTQDRRRYLNGLATLMTLLSVGVTPIINENDTVATDEIRYGDNDRLAARSAAMVGADRLVLLSDVDGLYTSDPRRDPKARRVARVLSMTPEIEAMAGGVGSSGASGGMVTKLMAAKMATQAGCSMAIARGVADGDFEPNRPIDALRQGAPATWFLASQTHQAARKAWIAGMKPMGNLIIDNGAAAAVGSGNSLLPAGLREVVGEFDRGDPVTIETMDGRELGAALAGYSSEEARRIAGLKSAEVEGALGYPARSALAHRNDMALWEAP